MIPSFVIGLSPGLLSLLFSRAYLYAWSWEEYESAPSFVSAEVLKSTTAKDPSSSSRNASPLPEIYPTLFPPQSILVDSLKTYLRVL